MHLTMLKQINDKLNQDNASNIVDIKSRLITIVTNKIIIIIELDKIIATQLQINNI